MAVRVRFEPPTASGALQLAGLCVASDAKFAIGAVDHCTLLHAQRRLNPSIPSQQIEGLSFFYEQGTSPYGPAIGMFAIG